MQIVSGNSYTSSGHNLVCTRCGETDLERHSYSYMNYSNTYHRSACICGYSRLSAHIIRDSTATIKRCIYCNAIVESGFGAVVGMSVGTVQYITENGTYIRPDGIIVISDTDYELLLRGELDLDNILCNYGCSAH